MNFSWFTIVIGLLAIIANIGIAWLTRMHSGKKELLSDAKDVRTRLDKMEVKVDTLWAFQIRRGIVEGVSGDNIKLNSPATISEKGRQYFEKVRNVLGTAYALRWKNMSDMDALIDIEVIYGETLMKEVCIPSGMSQGACLVGALAIAKEVAGVEPVVEIEPTINVEKLDAEAVIINDAGELVPKPGVA